MATGKITSFAVDISSSIAVNQSRASVTTKKAFLYPNGRVDLHIEGTFAANLSAAQTTVFTISSNRPASNTHYPGVAIVQGANLVAVDVASTNINIMHGGASNGDALYLSVSWYV